MKVDPPPEPEDLKARREGKYIVDPKDVLPKDDLRARAWAHGVISKHENKLHKKWKHGQVVTSGVVKPEDIDIRNIYPFSDLNWIIYRHHDCWNLMLRSKEKMIFVASYAKM